MAWLIRSNSAGQNITPMAKMRIFCLPVRAARVEGKCPVRVVLKGRAHRFINHRSKGLLVSLRQTVVAACHVETDKAPRRAAVVADITLGLARDALILEWRCAMPRLLGDMADCISHAEVRMRRRSSRRRD